MEILQNLLKVQDPEKPKGCKYSQSRVYLFLSVLTILGMSITSIAFDVENKNFQYALDTVFWMAIFFGSYALVGKGMKYQHIQKMGDKSEAVS